MGQYFYFYNKTIGKRSHYPCSLDWTKSVESVESVNDDQIFDIFIGQIKRNKWNITDNIIARGDDGYVIKWHDYLLF